MISLSIVISIFLSLYILWMKTKDKNKKFQEYKVFESPNRNEIDRFTKSLSRNGNLLKLVYNVHTSFIEIWVIGQETKG